jgi:flagellar hook-basal body complex protein FliE
MIERVGDMLPAMPGIGGATEGKVTGGKDFSSYVRDATVDAIDTMNRGETLSKQGIAGTADLNDVVAAVNDAELTLQTVTTLRDKLVQAYQEIIRMPV